MIHYYENLIFVQQLLLVPFILLIGYLLIILIIYLKVLYLRGLEDWDSKFMKKPSARFSIMLKWSTSYRQSSVAIIWLISAIYFLYTNGYLLEANDYRLTIYKYIWVFILINMILTAIFIATIKNTISLQWIRTGRLWNSGGTIGGYYWLYIFDNRFNERISKITKTISYILRIILLYTLINSPYILSR